VNPDVVVRWNADKRYLRDLARAGVTTVPTRWMERGDAGESLETVLVRSGWTDVVVKPVVSASAHQTWRISRDMAARDRSRVASLVESSGAVLVQPFIAEVLGEGEWSLVFIAGEYSHAALKRPAAADFRVQWEHGGRADPAEPPPPLVHDAHDVVAAAARRCGLAISDVAYARVDGVQRDGRLLLMELECLEPHLFLGYSPTAATRLARAVLAAAGR
jgi:glutathione synthase/RimK-type ligase-like ATP-grasp enzyme